MGSVYYMLLLGYDIGTSSIKAALLDADTQRIIATAVSPKTEMKISAPRPGWAEQSPLSWWENVKEATAMLISSGMDTSAIEAVGITYQMHGLVVVDKNKNPIRPAIIWCDSRAVSVGQQAAEKIGYDKCLFSLLNYPGNFTAMKLKWLMDNEPETYGQIHRMMLPGDYIAMKMTDRIVTTYTGLSEGIFWDFRKNQISGDILNYLQIDPAIIPEAAHSFSVQGELTRTAADELGLKPGIKVSYRAGDQPNNAFSLNVLNPGEVAATAGTSGVVYGIADKPNYDKKSRVNIFLHVNDMVNQPRLGVLLCLNGAGILNRWIKTNILGPVGDYNLLNNIAHHAPPGSSGLVILPFGNGAERTLMNADIGGSIHGINFNIHNRAHLFRAAQEGIVFAMKYGLDIMKDMGVAAQTIRAGSANMFLSSLFTEAFATVTGAVVELYNTDGSQGAARGAGLGAGIYGNFAEAFTGLEKIKTIEPNRALEADYDRAYNKWRDVLSRTM